jgi:hypothetical protein
LVSVPAQPPPSDGWYLSHFREERTVPLDAEKQDRAAELRSVITRNGEAWAELLAGEIDPDALIVERDEEWIVRSPLARKHGNLITAAPVGFRCTPEQRRCCASGPAVAKSGWREGSRS